MIRIDGRATDARGTVLEACRTLGVQVPTLCHDSRLSAGGHCRACIVEVDGELRAACTTLARDGAVVLTDSPSLRAYRRDLGELMLAEASPSGAAAALIASWGADGSRYGRRIPTHRIDDSHALIRFDADKCVRCRRCLRACEEIEGAFVFAIEGRGENSHLAWGGVPFAETACVSCGACLELCPAEALTAKPAR